MNKKLLILLISFVVSNGVLNAQGKKSGDFKTVWESEFSNKATRLAMGNEEGTFILGTDDNSATVLNTGGKQLWEGEDRKSTRLNSSHSTLSRMPSSA